MIKGSPNEAKTDENGLNFMLTITVLELWNFGLHNY